MSVQDVGSRISKRSHGISITRIAGANREALRDAGGVLSVESKGRHLDPAFCVT